MPRAQFSKVQNSNLSRKMTSNFQSRRSIHGASWIVSVKEVIDWSPRAGVEDDCTSTATHVYPVTTHRRELRVEGALDLDPASPERRRHHHHH
ncbi:hypothetical protein E2C01_098977 [Portunus trituberculatus]|uniref:Uncharacterized protein n=1 Tax=Portunus trituberculatus TaxID=210409 RepID=A0A5B7K9M2_PORTR|nr:hypothetical protein [Portunus trituberculatus]